MLIFCGKEKGDDGVFGFVVAKSMVIVVGYFILGVVL